MIFPYEWQAYFLTFAQVAGLKSKDPSTKVGAVLVRPDKTIASTGYNGFPKRLPDTPEHLLDRNEKMLRTVHAEQNALRRCPDHSTEGYTLVTTRYPCAMCALEIIDYGIANVLVIVDDANFMERWGAALVDSMRLFKEAGVNVECFYPPEWNVVSISEGTK